AIATCGTSAWWSGADSATGQVERAAIELVDLELPVDAVERNGRAGFEDLATERAVVEPRIDLDARRALRDEHVMPERRQREITGLLHAAIDALGAPRQDLEHEGGIHQHVVGAAPELERSADDDGVRIDELVRRELDAHLG